MECLHVCVRRAFCLPAVFLNSSFRLLTGISLFSLWEKVRVLNGQTVKDMFSIQCTYIYTNTVTKEAVSILLSNSLVFCLRDSAKDYSM